MCKAQVVPVKSTLLAFSGVAILSAATFAYLFQISNVELRQLPEMQRILGASFTNNLSNRAWVPFFQSPSLQSFGNREEVEVYVAYYHENKQRSEIISSSNRVYDANKWSLVSRIPSNKYQMIEINNIKGERRLVSYVYVNELSREPSQIKFKLSQVLQALLGQQQSSVFIAVSKPLDDLPSDSEKLDSALESMVSLLKERLFSEK